MGKRLRPEEPMYRVWRSDEREEDETYKDYGALSVRDAAKLYAVHCHTRRDGWEWTWPITVHVKNSLTGEIHVVEVAREMVPEFVAGLAEPLKMDPAVHTLHHGAPLCADIRLQGAPGRWPEGQTWIGLPDFVRLKEPLRRMELDKLTCPKCKRRTPTVVATFEQLGLGK